MFAGGLCGLLLALVGYADRAAELVAMFDDPSSLTGRVQIWPVLFRFAADHPLLGAGYGSFWAVGESSPIYGFDAGWLTTITHAHNGYIDMLVQIGTTVALASMVTWPLHLLLVRPLPRSWSRWLLAAILLFCWMHNLLETSLLDRANIVWVMLVMAYTLLQRGCRNVTPQHADRALKGAGAEAFCRSIPKGSNRARKDFREPFLICS